jgi:hypothetical protein
MEKLDTENFTNLLERPWYFVADMNYSGSVTISDFYLWIKWLYFYPGDIFLKMVAGELPRLISFFEMSNISNSYGGILSGILSAIAWISLPAILAISLVFLAILYNHLIKDEWAPRYILYWFLVIITLIAISESLGLGLVTLILLLLSRCIYIYNYIPSGKRFKTFMLGIKMFFPVIFIFLVPPALGFLLAFLAFY